MRIKVTEQTVSLDRAAKLLGIGTDSVKGGLITGRLPIGCAWKNEGSSTYNYNVSAYRLGEYLGLTKEEVVKGELI